MGPSALSNGVGVSDDHIVAIDVVAVEDAVLGAVRETVAEVTPTCHATVTLDSSLERDLGLDSLVRVELLMRIEDALDVRFSDSLVVDAAPRFQDRGQVAATVHALREADSVVLPLEVRTLLEALESHASAYPERASVRARWSGPRLRIQVAAVLDPHTELAEADHVCRHVELAVLDAIPQPGQ